METYKYDTHVHTSQTSACGRVEGRDAARLYREAGYRGIVITDHYCSEYFDYLDEAGWQRKIARFLEGYRDALEEGMKIGIEVILGLEIRFTENYNDYLVFGVGERFLVENKELYKLGLKEFRKLADENGLLVFQAHPFRIGIEPAAPALIDGVEVYNGNPRQFSRNNMAFAFAFENNLMMISGSDFHQKQDLARGGIILPEVAATSESFADLLVKCKTPDIIRTDSI